jgi:hypothetical protein
MKATLFAALALISSLGLTHGATVTQWSFNSSAPDNTPSTGVVSPCFGTGSASLVGGTTATFATGDTKADPAGSTDNSAWNTAKYPAFETNNKSAGVRFDADTTGFDGIQVTWAQRNSGTASRYARFQYTVDGVTFEDGPVIAMEADSVFAEKWVDLSGIPGAANNPAFGFQILTEFEESAMGMGVAAYVATKADSKYGTTGTIRYDMVTVSGTAIAGANTAPSLSSPPDQTIRVNRSTLPLELVLSDAEDPAESLTLTGASSNDSVIAGENIKFEGGGASRTVTVTAGSEAGSATVTLTVTDSGGRTASASFNVTVLPENTLPTISPVSRTNTLVNTTSPAVEFSIGDMETAADDLALTAASANPLLLPDSQILFGGTGSNRTVTLTPALNQTGVAPISITVSDGGLQSTTTFPLLVTASETVLLDEPFAYPDGPVITNSAGLWRNRSGTDGQCSTASGQLLLSAAQTEDIAVPFIGTPFSKSNGTVLYASFRVNFASLPKIKPGLFAHFSDGSAFRGRISAGTSNAPAGCFRLFVANGADAPTELPRNLTPGTPHTVVARYEIDTAVTTFWLNPESESDPGVMAADPQTATRVAYFGFRQDADLGSEIAIDDLKIGLSFASVLPGKTPEDDRLNVRLVGNLLVLNWRNRALALEWAPVLNGPYFALPGAASPYSVGISGKQQYFRLRSP